MNKTLLLSFLTGIMFTGSIKAQTSDFKLSDYKLPDLKRHSLDFDLDVNGSNSHSSFKYALPSSSVIEGYTYFSGNIYLNYNSYLNKASRQSDSRALLYSRVNYRKNKENDIINYKYLDLYPIFMYNRNNRYYYAANKFVETDFSVNYNFEYYRRRVLTGDDYLSINRIHILKSLVPLKWGVGRIEQVQDARHAIYIIDELSKQNRMSSDKSKDEIIGIAEKISSLKNERYFDYRLKRIEEIETIDSFFRSNNYIIESDARYFTTLYDMWDYGNYQVRESGTRFSASIIPGYYYYFTNNADYDIIFGNDDFGFSALTVNAGFELSHEKPLNLYWQNSIDISGYVGIVSGTYKTSSLDENSKLRVPNLQVNYFHRIGFYPNTRTNIDFAYSLQYMQMLDKSDIENNISGFEGKGFKGTTELTINYYISPRLRLNVGYSLNYVWRDSENAMCVDFDYLTVSSLSLENSMFLVNTADNYFYLRDLYHQLNIRLQFSFF